MSYRCDRSESRPLIKRRAKIINGGKNIPVPGILLLYTYDIFRSILVDYMGSIPVAVSLRADIHTKYVGCCS